MKKVFLSLLLCCASATLIYAQNEEISYSNDNNSFNLKVTDNAQKLRVTINGDIRLGDDDKSITGLSRGGSLYYRKKDQSVKVENTNGGLEYTINGKKKHNLNRGRQGPC